jgi:hypothetical protein
LDGGAGTDTKASDVTEAYLIFPQSARPTSD